MEAMYANSALLSQKMLLSSDVTIHEVDQDILIYHGLSQKYFRVGKLSKVLIDRLQMNAETGDDLVKYLGDSFGFNRADVTAATERFLQQMIEAGVIISEREPDRTETGMAKAPESRTDRNLPFSMAGTKSLIKLVRIRGLDSVLKGLSKHVPDSLLKSVLYIVPPLALISLVAIIYTLNSGAHYVLSGYQGLFVLPLVLLHLIGHEMTHALVCHKKGGTIREAGFGLLYFLIPAGYVDLTDTYLLDRKSRAHIAIAGPAFDLTAGFFVLLAFWMTDGMASSLFYTLLFVQFMIFCLNCNLLIPSDLLRFLENRFQMPSLRKHSFEYLKCVLLSKEKPPYLKRVKGLKENFYLLYAVMSCLYITSLMIIFAYLYLKLFI